MDQHQRPGQCKRLYALVVRTVFLSHSLPADANIARKFWVAVAGAQFVQHVGWVVLVSLWWKQHFVKIYRFLHFQSSNDCDLKKIIIYTISSLCHFEVLKWHGIKIVFVFFFFHKSQLLGNQSSMQDDITQYNWAKKRQKSHKYINGDTLISKDSRKYEKIQRASERGTKAN